MKAVIMAGGEGTRLRPTTISTYFGNGEEFGPRMVYATESSIRLSTTPNSRVKYLSKP